MTTDTDTADDDWQPCEHCDGCTLANGTHTAWDCDCGCPDGPE